MTNDMCGKFQTCRMRLIWISIHKKKFHQCDTSHPSMDNYIFVIDSIYELNFHVSHIFHLNIYLKYCFNYVKKFVFSTTFLCLFILFSSSPPWFFFFHFLPLPSPSILFPSPSQSHALHVHQGSNIILNVIRSHIISPTFYSFAIIISL